MLDIQRSLLMLFIQVNKISLSQCQIAPVDPFSFRNSASTVPSLFNLFVSAGSSTCLYVRCLNYSDPAPATRLPWAASYFVIDFGCGPDVLTVSRMAVQWESNDTVASVLGLRFPHSQWYSSWLSLPHHYPSFTPSSSPGSHPETLSFQSLVIKKSLESSLSIASRIDLAQAIYLILPEIL